MAIYKVELIFKVITYCINNIYIKLNIMLILILFNILNVKGFKYVKNFYLHQKQ